MDIYDILSEAKNGSVEEATKALIEGISEEIKEKGEIDLESIAKKLIEDEDLFTEEEIKRVAVVEFVSDFVNNHKEEIESNYNLLPLTNDPDIGSAISDMRDSEVKGVTKSALNRSSSKIEPEVKEQISKIVDSKFDGYKEELTDYVRTGEESVRQNPNDESAKEDLKNDQESLKVFQAFEQNKDGIKEGISRNTLKETEARLEDREFFDAHLPEGEYKDKIAKKSEGAKISIEEVQTQLESNPIWAKITSKVPSDELYELMGKVLAKKANKTR